MSTCRAETDNALGGEVAGPFGGVGREAPFLPLRQGGEHQAGVREPACPHGQITSSPSCCSARHGVSGLATEKHHVKGESHLLTLRRVVRYP